MKRTLLLFLTILIAGFLFTSCRNNHFRINVSHIDVNVKIKRLEQDLFTINPGNIIDSIGFLKNKYDGFLKYFSYVINIGEMGDSLWKEGLSNFCTDKMNNEVYRTTIEIFPSLSQLENGITDAYRHYRYYFPSKRIPGVFTCICGFNNSIITGDSVLGIGLDRYLGQDCKYYKQLGIYKYQMARMAGDHILPDCMYGWASSEWDFKNVGYTQSNVLTDMIHEGKLLYFVKCMIPDTPDDLIFGFTPGQLKFCRNNEGLMWQYLVEHNLLFSTDNLTRRKLTGESPFTTYFSSESPGRAAAWIGFKIVESYMAKNRYVTLEKLMQETDIQGILENARYRPSVGK